MTAAAQLRAEAEVLGPAVVRLKALYEAHELAAHDVVGAYVLLYLGTRRRPQGAWCGGKLTAPIVADDGAVSDAASARLVDVPGLLDALGGADLLAKRLPGLEPEKTRVVDVFNRLKLAGIKKNGDDFVNRCIVLWALRRCPLVLLFHIPSPLAVLRMQAGVSAS